MMRKIEKGTLVSVKPDTSINRHWRPSEGRIGFVKERKKWRTTNEENNNNGGGGAGGDENNIHNNNTIGLTQDSNVTTATAAMTFIRYLLDNCLSQDVDKSWVSVAMLGTTTLKRPGSFSSNPSKDELWIAVEKCWKIFQMDALARGYVCHGQMVSVLIACNGGDDFVREHGGLNCNVCNCCATVCNESGKPTGVEVVSCFDGTNDDGGGGGDDNKNHNKDTTRQQQKTPRYKKPDVDNQ